MGIDRGRNNSFQAQSIEELFGQRNVLAAELAELQIYQANQHNRLRRIISGLMVRVVEINLAYTDAVVRSSVDSCTYSQYLNGEWDTRDHTEIPSKDS